MHICRKWRRIVFDSQRALQIQLFCTHGTPVLKTLECWPTLPIVVQYGGLPTLDPPAPEDEDNIVVALKKSDCVTSISLTVTRSLSKKLSAIEKPFSKLEDLVLLYSSKNLLDLHLREILDPLCFQPAALTHALSGMVRLRSLTLHFLSTAKYPTPAPPSEELVVVLPALTSFDFQGNTEYLEHLVARIYTPLLRDIKVTFLDKSNFDLSSEFRNFTDRIGMHKSYRRADILSCKGAISISLTRPGDPARLKFQLFCEQLSEQLFFMGRFCIHFSASLFNVEDLRISAKRPSRPEAGLHSDQWQELLNSFTAVKWFVVSGNLSTDIVHSLQLEPYGRRKVVLPALHQLCILQPESRYLPLREAAVSLTTSRWLSGYPIAVEYERRHIGEPHRTGTVYHQG
jgi:hypothetical protein